MLQGEHSAILLTFIKLPFGIKIFVLSILSGRFRQVLLYMKLLLGLSIRQVYVSFILVTRSIFDSKDRFILFNVRFEVLLFKVLCIMHYDKHVT